MAFNYKWFRTKLSIMKTEIHKLIITKCVSECDNYREREKDIKVSIVDNKMAINLMPWTLSTRALILWAMFKATPLICYMYITFLYITVRAKLSKSSRQLHHYFSLNCLFVQTSQAWQHGKCDHFSPLPSSLFLSLKKKKMYILLTSFMCILGMQGETLIPWSKRKGGFTACTFVFGKNIYHLQ